MLAHCFTCGKNARVATRVSRYLAEAGCGVLRFDFTGLGDSTGDFANTNFSSNVQDLLCASQALAKQYAAPRLLIGHSLGGTAVLAAAPQLKDVQAVVTINAPSDPVHVERLLQNDLASLEETGEAEVDIGGRTFKIHKQFLADIRSACTTESIAKLGRALLVFHSPRDPIVGIENARQIFDAARHPKSFVSLDGADHLVTSAHDAEFISQMISAWSSRYVHGETVPVGTRERVIVDEVGSQFAQSIRVGSHRLRAGEPEQAGGDDHGPTPYELLLAALGACTSMTLRMYAKHKQLPLEAVSVELSHKRIHAEDCRSCESTEGRVDHIERTLRIRGPLSDEQCDRLVEIAGKCPVHRTLKGEVEIVTRREP